MSLKNCLLTMMILIGSSSFCFAQPIIKLWDKTLGGGSSLFNGALGQDSYITNSIINNQNQLLFTCESTSDSGFNKSQNSFQPLPQTFSSNSGTWLLSLDPITGLKQWDKVFGGRNISLCTGLYQQNANSFILNATIFTNDTTHDLTAPVVYPNIINPYGIWILNFDSLGNKIWNKRIVADNLILNINDILVDSNFIYFVGSIIDSVSSTSGDFNLLTCQNSSDLFLLKFNLQTQQIEWTRAIGGAGRELGIVIKKGWNNDLIVGGRTNSPFSCNQTVGAWTTTGTNIQDDYFVLVIDTAGTVKWQKHFGGLKEELLIDLLKTKDGGYLAYGITNSNLGYDVSQDTLTSTKSCWLVKMDSLGTKIWDRRFGPCGSNILFSTLVSGSFAYGSFGGQGRRHVNHLCIETADEGYLFGITIQGPICGDVNEAAKGNGDYWLVKTDLSGNKLWDKRYGGPSSNNIQSLVELDKSIYIVSGFHTTSAAGFDKTEVGPGGNDVWIVCFKDTSLVTGNTELAPQNFQFNIWPNPSNQTLYYSIANTVKIEQIQVINLLGEVELKAENLLDNTINVNSLQAGTYIISAKLNNNALVRKRFVVVR
jgi:hypothetical protein